MSMTAVNAGLAAASAANNAAAQAAAHRARVDRCTIFESQFDVAKASVAEKQEYASCVATLYPQPFDQSETYLLKGCIVVLILSVIIGAIYGYREFNEIGGSVMGALLGPCIAALGLMAVAGFYAGISFLFS